MKTSIFSSWKTSFSVFELVVKTIGGTTCIAYCGPPFGPCENFHSSKSCSKPSHSKRNCFLSWKQAFFHLKNKFFDFWIGGQNHRGTTCIAYCGPPLVHVKIFTHQNRAPNHPILNETVSFHENKHFFIWKTSFSIFELVVKTIGGTTCIAYCGPPFGPG